MARRANDAGDDNTQLDGEATEVSSPIPKTFTRGMNVRAAVAWVRGLHGERGVRDLSASLPADVRDECGGANLRPSVLAWVPFLAHAELLQKIDDLFGEGDLVRLADVGRGMAFRDFPLLARPVARMLSPGLFLDMSVKIWGLYHSHGTWEISRGERELQGVLLDHAENHPAFCATMRGWIEGAMLFSGATECSVIEERCATRGAPVCSLRINWRERRDAPRERRPRAPS